MVAVQIKFYFIALLFFIWLFVVSTFAQDLLSCSNPSFDALGYSCSKNVPENKCVTFAILRANSAYSSLYNLSYYLGINQFVIAEVNGFSSDTDLLQKDQLLWIPLECSCDSNRGVFQAELTKIAIEGESFYNIAESLEGLTTCKAIKEKNPKLLYDNLVGKTRVVIPLSCACPSSSEVNSESRFLLSYPVIEGDTISKLSLTFNTTQEAIVSANSRFGVLKPEQLVPLSTLLIPLNDDPGFGGLVKRLQPNSGFSVHKKHRKMWKVGICLWVSGAIIGTFFVVIAALLAVQRNRKKQATSKKGDLELQKLSLSVRTTSDKKVSFEGSDQDTIDCRVIEVTPRKGSLEIFTIEELKKATEDFNSSNLIEGSVFHGRLKGKNLAIKRANQETTSKIDFGLFHSTVHHHPNIIRLLGATTVTDDHDSGLVFEYAVNGSLKDWLHGGLAMKSHFIASCNCFLTWNQRLRICLDIAMALNYMHHIMVPNYVHTKLKSRNIFLDEEFNAKVGNFGMAKCVQDDTNESQCYWNKGYVAPESLNNDSTFSTKTDIFAYGVIVLELLSGKTPVTTLNNKCGEEESISHTEKIKSILDSKNEDELKEWMDSALGENYSFDAAVKLANIARSCTDKDPSLRPSASDIVEKLSMLLMTVPLPEKDESLGCESSSKPLVLAVQNNL